MNKHHFFILITGWFLLTQMFPPFNYLILRGGALTLSIFVGVSLLLFPELFTTKSIKAMLVYGMMMLLYYIAGNAFFKTIGNVIVPFLSMMSGLIIIEYVIKYDSDYKYTRFFVLFAIVLNVIMALFSIPQLIVNPLAIREFDEDLTNVSVSYWLCSYQVLHGLPYLLAPMVFLCKKLFKVNKIQFILWVVPLALLSWMELLSNAVTAFLISVVMIIVGLLVSAEEFSKKNIAKIVLMVFFVFLFMTPSVIVPLLNTTQNYFQTNTNTYRRLEEIKTAVVYGESEGDLAARQELYDDSQALFWESPLVGTANPELISRHTWIWDRLACFGIIFIIPLLMVFVYHIKLVYKNLKHTKITYIWGVVSYLMMLYFKNEFGTGTWLYAFALLPLLCRYTDYLIDNKTINN